MGGLKLESELGPHCRSHIVRDIANGMTGVRGTADLCAYFLLRAFTHLNTAGCLGLIATNTIGQGDARTVGLEQLKTRRATIFRAHPSKPWPGDASLEIAQLWITRRAWNGPATLDASNTIHIAPSLAAADESDANPKPLAANAGRAFQGANVLGLGFLVTKSEAEALMSSDAKYADVLCPYLNGQELNSLFDTAPTRWVINFRDWPLDIATAPKGYDGPTAADFPRCLSIIEQRVKPERIALPEKNAMNIHAKEYWWQFRELRKQLLTAIASRDNVLARARIANIHSVVQVPSQWVMNEKTVVFVDCSFAVLQSCFHESWARKYSSTLRNDMQYTPTMCLETFPFTREDAVLTTIGVRYHEHRASMMLSSRMGLTKTYKCFHDSHVGSTEVRDLRKLQVEMDNAVAHAYGWSDLDLGHGFHETKQGIRFTISEPARREVLQRLLKLNHERYAEEVRQGLHDKKGKAKKPAAGRKGKGSAAKPQPLFDDDTQ